MRCSVVGGDAPAVLGETDERARPRAAGSEETKPSRLRVWVSIRPRIRFQPEFIANSLIQGSVTLNSTERSSPFLSSRGGYRLRLE